MKSMVEWLIFPEGRTRQLFAVAILACAFSLLLTGRQVTEANWGLIDDHEVFTYLGPDLRLPFGEIWETLINKTEVGQLQGRFRPSFYLLKVAETSLLGADVHLWYLVNSICFAIFLASICSGLSRFVGLWLSGALTAAVALLPMWADVWSRLGPSEIFGAACLGLMLFSTDAILFAERRPVRLCAAVALTVFAIILSGLKETFLPIAAGLPAFVLGYAVMGQRLSLLFVAVLGLLLAACILAIGLVVLRELRSAGADYYGHSAGAVVTLRYAALGLIDGLGRTWWVWLLPIVVLQLLGVIPTRTWKERFLESAPAFAAYAFVIAMYAAQCGLYRMLFPHNNRYDFPAMLLIPLTACILIAEIASRVGLRYPKRTVDHALCAAAFFVVFFLVTSHLGRPPALAAAVRRNIEATSTFFVEVQRLAQLARSTPDRPIIIEAGGPIAYEGVHSLPQFLTALGVQNTISVRYHPDEHSLGPYLESLQRQLTDMETAQANPFTPLAEAWVKHVGGCFSVGLYTHPDPACVGFRISNGLDPAATSRSAP
ncbi:hypothetical protein [Bradyrhizobium sp. CCGUVB14]|uniref:hypothetical protein n=1 Tax=Bradyrhizobium sp. CCGUVB14 TaxID=2949628 RepID=UPI0020B3E2DF|nr:hypothetical protein [Bradyrhizobium sp. CCGUVB14]MCP3446161.1 hypothetical protein [Bradyrhizobium sp. CCGUVB14]